MQRKILWFNYPMSQKGYCTVKKLLCFLLCQSSEVSTVFVQQTAISYKIIASFLKWKFENPFFDDNM